MRKLTVKNFSVIKEAELEFGKITVLIGPQASGKSLLCKLAYFLDKIASEIIQYYGFSTNGSLDVVEEQIVQNFVESFHLEGEHNFHIEFHVEHSFSLILDGKDISSPLRIVWPTGFDEAYLTWPARVQAGGPSFESNRRRGLMDGIEVGPIPVESDSVYVPTGRDFFSTPNRGNVALSMKHLDWITRRFSTEFDTVYKDLRESYSTNRWVLERLGEASVKMMQGRVVREDNRTLFESVKDGRKLPFEILSSGTLAMLPLFNVLAQVARDTGFLDSLNMPAPKIGTVFIEEPELSVFPETQYLFAKTIADLASTKILWKDYAITTHSPYILTAFDNLIKAGIVGRSSEAQGEAVRKLIEEKYWIQPEDFRAYKIVEGNLEPIYNQETGELDADYLDNVSGQIAEEYSNLLEIQYGR